jgi:FMN phosphatase YigB (HAD superfamily)
MPPPTTTSGQPASIQATPEVTLPKRRSPVDELPPEGRAQFDALVHRFKESAWGDLKKGFGKPELALAYDLFGVLAGKIDAGNAGLTIHIQHTARCARILAEQFNHYAGDARGISTLNPDMVEALAIVHDLGRYTTHGWYVNDLVLHDVFNHCEVDIRLRKAVLWPSDSFNTSQKFSNLQRILMLADMLSKTDLSTGTVSSMQQAIGYHLNSRGNMAPKTAYGIEKRMIEKFNQPAKGGHKDLVERWADVYRNLSNWANRMGIDLQSVQEEAQRLGSHYNNKPIVVFDLGGVVFKLADDTQKQELARKLNIDKAKVDDAVDYKDDLAKVQSGEMPEDVWATNIFARLYPENGYEPVPLDRESKIITIKETIGNLHVERYDQVVNYIQDLREQGYTVVALSDTIPSHIPHLKNAFYSLFDRIFCSPEIGVSKKSDRGHMAFWVVLATLGIDKKCFGFAPQSVVFVDDRRDCCSAAEKIGATSVQWPSETDESKLIRAISDLKRTLEDR